MSVLAPIVLFVYNRPWHTSQTLNFLALNELAKESVLYIFSDGYKDIDSNHQVDKVRSVRQLIRNFTYCKEVIIMESEINKGLYKSITDGLSCIFNKYDKAIILEDDIVTSIGFLRFMNDALDIYKNDNKVAGISGFSYISSEEETYFLSINSSWGWGTWKRVWDSTIFNSEYLLETINKKRIIKEFNLGGFRDSYGMLLDHVEGKNQSWDIQFFCSQFLNHQLFLYPKKTMVMNIGFDEGTHCHGLGRSDIAESNKLLKEVTVKPIEIVENRRNKKLLKEHFKNSKTKLVVRILRKLKKYIN